ncbi:MAG: molybdenum cofactor guanylyltransferase [Sphingomonadaceae bacterium]
MRVLGVVLAGGQSRRFGSDKALAILDGRRLLDHAVAAMSQMVAAVVVVGREEAPVATVPDRPRARMGPLGGICGALAHAQAEGFDAILTVPVDALRLPDDLLQRLSPGPAFAAQQPVIGLWPVACLPALDALLASTAKHSLRAFAEAVDAREVALPGDPANINTQKDLAQLQSLGTSGGSQALKDQLPSRR